MLYRSSSRPDPPVQNELTDIVSSAAELSHAQAAKVISPRSELHSALQLSEFVELFYESWDFVVKGEVICRRMIVGLRGVIVGQVRNLNLSSSSLDTCFLTCPIALTGETVPSSIPSIPTHPIGKVGRGRTVESSRSFSRASTNDRYLG